MDILDDDNVLDSIYGNIEEKTGVPVPEVVKNVSNGVIRYNIDRVNELINIRKGKKILI